MATVDPRAQVEIGDRGFLVGSRRALVPGDAVICGRHRRNDGPLVRHLELIDLKGRLGEGERIAEGGACEGGQIVVVGNVEHDIPVVGVFVDDVGGHRHSESDGVACNVAETGLAQFDDGCVLLHQIGILFGVHLDDQIAGVEIARQRRDDLGADGAVVVFVAQRLLRTAVQGAEERERRRRARQQRHQDQARPQRHERMASNTR